MENLDLPFAAPTRDVYTVSRLNREVRILIERGLSLLWIQAEISNLSRPSSGHWYFSLKDRDAQVRCAMFRQRNVLSQVDPRDGLLVLARVRVSLYEPRGEFQLVVEHLEEAGEGALRRQFEVLKARLQREGLFDPARKRPLPKLPRRVGVVTSPTGAAIRDILNILKRRFPAIPVLVYPVPVQGAGASLQIAAAIERASRRRDCDVLIVARGGGSLEDLWAFNEERVARAIAACAIPTVSGVGHEVDVTIADFVADVRAPTPSGAAELVVPDRREWLERLAVAQRRLAGGLGRRLTAIAQRHSWLSRRLAQCHPGVALRHRAQRLDDFEQRLRYLVRARLAAAASRCQLAGRALNAVSPLATLERGYAIVTRHPEGTLVRSSDQLREGDLIEARLMQGQVKARVE